MQAREKYGSWKIIFLRLAVHQEKNDIFGRSLFIYNKKHLQYYTVYNN